MGAELPLRQLNLAGSGVVLGGWEGGTGQGVGLPGQGGGGFGMRPLVASKTLSPGHGTLIRATRFPRL